MRAHDLADLIPEPPPADPDCEQALHAWRWVGGWFPERLMIYFTLHPYAARDAALIIDMMLIIADRLNRHTDNGA